MVVAAWAWFWLFKVMALILATAEMNSTTTTTTTTTTGEMSSPVCQRQCGSVEIPYPFGIGSNCSINSGFTISCNTSGYTSPKTFLGDTNIEVYNISDSKLRVTNVLARRCYNSSGVAEDYYALFDLGNMPFTFSEENKFFLVGCDDYVEVYGTGMGGNLNFSFSCLSWCPTRDDVIPGYCYGSGCCQTSVPAGTKYYDVSLSTEKNHSEVLSFNPCAYAFLGEQAHFSFTGLSDLNDTNFENRTHESVPVVLDWSIGDRRCKDAEKERDYACKGNSVCVDTVSGGYLCNCSHGYQGNPYLTDGCTDIDECALDNKPCDKICINTQGSYNCSCPKGYFGDGRIDGSGCIRSATQFPLIKLTIGLTLSFLSLLIGLTWVFFAIKRRKLVRMREKFFEQNGGLFLKQQITTTSTSSAAKATRLFTIEELEKATNNFSDDEILGQGGYGTVYRGVLVDQSVVAIKKSKIMDTTQIEQFINEVIVLTQVSHRNVVQLLGCCLEAQVPLLVYEFIANGTLFHHIHSQESKWLSWGNRLRIAAESAGALAYLHSASAVPIIHRDVKSSNILIDENYTAKISDFGASRLVSLDHTQITTLIQGTLGYLDPQYFHTSQLTEKSDVYSFGVVLAELLTGQRPLCMDRSKEERHLATYFVISLKENRLFQIVEPRILKEGSLEQVQAIGELVKRCLNSSNEERPTMKEVAAELENLRKLNRYAFGNGDHAGLIMENGPSDLYTVCAGVAEDLSLQYTSDTIHLLPAVNSPR